MRFSTRTLLTVVTVLAVWCAAAAWLHEHIPWPRSMRWDDHWIFSFGIPFCIVYIGEFIYFVATYRPPPDMQGLHGDGI